MAASANLLSCFWVLGSTSDVERLAAAKDLLEILSTKEEDLQYCVERLVRGLGSNRKGARQGFSVALTELLATFPQVTAAQVLALVDQHLQPVGSAKAEEERGCLFGQLFALMCLLRSGHLSGKDGLRVLRQLAALGGRKSYLQQVCCASLRQALHQLSGKVSCSAVLGELSVALEGGWAGCSPEGLYLVLSLEQVYGGKQKLRAGLKELQWSDKPVMHEANLPALASLLHSVTDPLHIVWPVVLAAAHRSTTFSRFWKDVVSGMVTPSLSDDLCHSSTQHQCVALHLVQLLLPDLAPHEIHVVLSPSLLHCLASSLASKDSAVHPAANQLARSIYNHCSGAHSQASRVAMMLQLFGRHGLKHLQDCTDVHSLSQLVEQVEADDILEHLEALVAFLFGSDSTSHSMTVKEGILEQVSVLLQHPVMRRHSRGSMVASACFLLLLTGFQGVKQPVSDQQVRWMPRNIPSSFDVEDQVSQLARQNLTAALTNIIRGRRAHSDELCFLPLRDIVLFAEALLNSGCHAHLALSAAWDGDRQEAWRTASLCVRRFSPSGSTLLEGALCLLHACLALQLLLEPASKAAAGMVGELAVMQQDVAASGQSVDDASAWCEVLTDMLLSMLSQPSSLPREVASQAFRMTMPHQTRESLDLLIAVVDPRRSEELTQCVTLIEEVESDGEEGGSEEDLGSQSEEESGSSVENDCSPDSPEVDQDFRSALKSALGPAALEMDPGESPSDLSDDTMMQRDSALSAVFRSHLYSKGAQQRRKEQARLLVDYRLRVLKLLEAFVKRQSSSPWLVDIIVPLVRLTYQGQAALSSRAADIATRICKGKVPGESSRAAVTALKDAMKLSYKVSSPEAFHVLTAAAMWLLKVVCHDGQDSPARTEALDIFRGVLWDFVTKRSSAHSRNCTVNFSLFQALFQRHGPLGWLLMSDTVAASAKAASSFKKVQCYQLMQLLFSGTAPGRDQHCHLQDVVAAAAKSVMEVADEVKGNSHLTKAQLRLVTEALLLLQTCVCVSSAAVHMVPSSLLATVGELMQMAGTHREKLLQSKCSQLLDHLRKSHTPQHSPSQDITPKAKRKKHN